MTSDAFVAGYMLLMGLAISGVWSVDIARGTGFDRNSGLLKARSQPDGALMLPHWIAEYTTAAGLVIGAIALFAGASWSVPVAAAALGATWYTSANSLGWALAVHDRRAYTVPMGVGLVGSTFSLLALTL